MATIRTSPELHRLDDNTWSYFPTQESSRIPTDEYEEIRIQAPKLDSGEERYQLIASVCKAFEQNRPLLKRSFFKNGLQVKIDAPERTIAGIWEVSLHHPPCLSKRLIQGSVNAITQSIPFFKTFAKRKTVVIDVTRPDCSCPRITPSIHQKAMLTINSSQMPPVNALRNTYPSQIIPEREIRRASFTDPYTLLAAEALKTISPFFVMETSHRGGYRFVLESNNLLRLESIVRQGSDVDTQITEENRTVVRAYKTFLLHEFGADFLAQIEVSYDIHFDQMIEQGLPLMPDHVSKCNIGANDIGMNHIEDLWKQLHLIHPGQADPFRRHLEPPALNYLLGLHEKLGIPFRILRGIYRQIPRQDVEPTLDDLRSLLQLLLEPSISSVRDLSPDLFNTVVDMIMPSDTERLDSFTSREIRHLCIMGFNTMGEPNVSNPCRDLLELLHVFPQLRSEEKWKNFYEILSHVVVKKSLFRKSIDPSQKQLRIGTLIPGPNTIDHKRRWYYTDALFDDSQGNVNYVLLPGTNRYRTADNRQLPMVKLFRSTASNQNAMNWQDSLEADLNAEGSPGSLKPELSLPYERKHFDERTIPIWMGYLIVALSTGVSKIKKSPNAGTLNDPTKKTNMKQMQQATLESAYAENIEKAARECLDYLKNEHPEESREELQQLLENKNLLQIEAKLINYGIKFKEDPRFKHPQDIACVGHSLGGALAQAGVHLFSARLKRMPLPSQQFICYSSDAPAIDNEKDAEFMRFGQEHRVMFKTLKVMYRDYLQFESGDVVSMSGGSHLGTTFYDRSKDPEWLDVKIGVFAPKEDAEALSIVNPPTHGRRIGTAEDGRDYTYTRLEPRELHEFDHSYWLSGRLKKIFNYRIFNSPKLVENIRKIAGKVLSLPMKILDRFVTSNEGVRDTQGVLAVNYARP